ncbi:MAG: tetratricopeptide repeat protein [Polyangiaceae bacterium]
MSTVNKRLAFLEDSVAKGSQDPFAWYGLAMEYRKLERWDDALATFEKLRAFAADYVAMYLMCGQMLEGRGKKDDAKSWYDAGIAQAKKKGDTHALSELEGALRTLEG